MHRVGEVAESPVQGVADQLGVHVVGVAREREGGRPGPVTGEGAEQPVGEGPLARAVEALDHDQSSHGPGYCQSGPLPLR